MESVTRTRVPFQPINTNIYEHNEEFRKQRSLSAGSNIRNAPTYTLEQSKQLPPSVGLSPYVRAPTYTDRQPNSYHNKFPSYPQQYANTYGQYYDQPDIPQMMQPEIQDPWRSEKTIYRQQMAPQIYQDIQPMLPSASFSGSQHYSNPTHSQYNMPTLVQQSYGNNPHYQSQYQHQTQMQTPMVQGQNYQTYQQPYTNYAPHTMTYSNQPQYVQNIPTAQNVNSDGFDFPTNTAYPQVMHHRLPLNHVPEQMYQYMESSQIDEDFGPSIQPPLIVHAQPGPIDLNKIPTETPKVNASIKTVDSLLHTETIPPTAKKEVSSSLFQVAASPSPNRERKPNVDDASSSHAKIIDDDKDEQESTSSSSSEEVVYDYKDKPRSATPTERRLSLGPCENLWQQAQRRQAAVKAAALEERKKAKETIARRNSIKARRNSKDLGSARRGSKS